MKRHTAMQTEMLVALLSLHNEFNFKVFLGSNVDDIDLGICSNCKCGKSSSLVEMKKSCSEPLTLLVTSCSWYRSCNAELW